MCLFSIKKNAVIFMNEIVLDLFHVELSERKPIKLTYTAFQDMHILANYYIVKTYCL